jgi:phosphoenolpyruvate-protein kinase (PTS system EI component)
MEESKLLEIIVANTTANIQLAGAINKLADELAEANRLAVTRHNTSVAKMDNVERAVDTIQHTLEAQANAKATEETQRHQEVERIHALLLQERTDRQKAILDGREGEREARASENTWVKQLVQQEMLEQKQMRERDRDLLVGVGKAIWDKGGQWVVLALAVLFLWLVSRMTGMSLLDIVGGLPK